MFLQQSWIEFQEIITQLGQRGRLFEQVLWKGWKFVASVKLKILNSSIFIKMEKRGLKVHTGQEKHQNCSTLIWMKFFSCLHLNISNVHFIFPAKAGFHKIFSVARCKTLKDWKFKKTAKTPSVMYLLEVWVYIVHILWKN